MALELGPAEAPELELLLPPQAPRIRTTAAAIAMSVVYVLMFFIPGATADPAVRD
jgi:hypothetical protein